MRGKEFSRRLTEISHEPRSSIQTSNGSYLHDVSSLERENEDLKVVCLERFLFYPELPHPANNAFLLLVRFGVLEKESA